MPTLQVSTDASLQVGEVTQTVEVTGDIPQIQTDRADVAIQFSQKYVEDLPVLNRNFTSFELLSPGTQKLPGFNHAATENPQGGGQIQVNGQHFSGTNFELDGTDSQDPILGIIVVNPNLDAIAEAKIALQDYDAESGKATSGVIRVQTKSGSNEFHGSGFYYYRNSDQQARDPFSNKPGVPLAAATWKQFGGSVGGPIIKDKLFFFGDYQGTKVQQGITNQYTVPTSEVVSTCNPMTNAASDTPGYCNLSEYLDAFGPVVGGVHSGQIYNPLGQRVEWFRSHPFLWADVNPWELCKSRNLIPIGMIGQNVGSLLALFPASIPGTAVNAVNFISNGTGPFDQKSFDTRIDYSAPHNYQVFGRFSLDYFSLSGKGGLGEIGGAGFGPGGLNGSSNVHNYSLATGFTKPIGTKWLTDVRFGYFKYNPQTAYSDAGTTPMTTLGFPGLNLGSTETGGFSGFLFTGNGSPSNFGDGLNVGRCNCPLTENEQQFQVENNQSDRRPAPHQVWRRYSLCGKPSSSQRSEPHRSLRSTLAALPIKVPTAWHWLLSFSAMSLPSSATSAKAPTLRPHGRHWPAMSQRRPPMRSAAGRARPCVRSLRAPARPRSAGPRSISWSLFRFD